MNGNVKFQARSGLSLIEIMMSVLVMSIGLIGILAAIPFGAFRLNQMRDADYSVTVAKNAFAIIEANQWQVPSRRTWYSSGSTDFDTYNNATGTSVADFTKPFLMDPIGLVLDGTVTEASASPTAVNDYIRITPTFTKFDGPILKYYFASVPAEIRAPFFKADGSINTVISMAKLDYYFRTSDDILFGIPDKTDEAGIRPKNQTEDITWHNSKDLSAVSYTNLPAFTGEYSWMAMMQPRTKMNENFRACPIFPESAVCETDVDVVVFKGRTDGSPYVFEAIQEGAGKAGGFFRLEQLPAPGNSTIDNLSEHLKNTACILLVGANPTEVSSDNPGVLRKFAKWYKVANFIHSNGEIHVTLTGSDCPEENGWAGGSASAYSVKAYVFPNVVGVYSRTISSTSNE
ncbi:MAG: hypothetical protein Q4G69_06650 [Planctomycetia bacterium]|nr:hypothetical protein [Planctomycetia bacterium]